jgi:small subunit ribosomal protein S4
MSRYTGPRLRKIRALGSELPALTSKRPSEKKQAPPGQHGATRLRSKGTTYKEQLKQKQKIRFNYGVNEKQLRRYFARAQRMRGATGANLLTLLESRLDNILFRAGFAPSIRTSRQIIGHGHVLVNGSKVDICSYQVSPNDVIELRGKVREVPIVLEAIERARSSPRPPFLEIDDANRRFKVLALPAREDVLLEVQEIMVVEFYSH